MSNANSAALPIPKPTPAIIAPALHPLPRRVMSVPSTPPTTVATAPVVRPEAMMGSHFSEMYSVGGGVLGVGVDMVDCGRRGEGGVEGGGG